MSTPFSAQSFVSAACSDAPELRAYFERAYMQLGALTPAQLEDVRKHLLLAPAETPVLSGARAILLKLVNQLLAINSIEGD